MQSVDYHCIGQMEWKLQATERNRGVLKTRIKSHARNKDHIVHIVSMQYTALQNVAGRPKKPQAYASAEAIYEIQIVQKHE